MYHVRLYADKSSWTKNVKQIKSFWKKKWHNFVALRTAVWLNSILKILKMF